MFAGITIRPFSPGFERNVFTIDQVFDDMGSAISRRGWVTICSADISIYRCQSTTNPDAVQFDLLHPDRGIGMTEIQKCTRRTHRSESGGGYYVYFFCNFFG